MMSAHGANPIFFNKKINIGRPEHLRTPYVRKHRIFALNPPPHPNPTPQSGRHICITPNMGYYPIPMYI